MKDFLPEIDYSKLDLSKIPLDKCSTNAIRFVHPERAAELLKEENI
jgi:hypothetical protein